MGDGMIQKMEKSCKKYCQCFIMHYFLLPLFLIFLLLSLLLSSLFCFDFFSSSVSSSSTTSMDSRSWFRLIFSISDCNDSILVFPSSSAEKLILAPTKLCISRWNGLQSNYLWYLFCISSYPLQGNKKWGKRKGIFFIFDETIRKLIQDITLWLWL